jgi:hypothetical protein
MGTTQMMAQIEGSLAVLIGKALWGCHRAADMATFQFGARAPRQDFFKRPAEVGEYALHVQCAWRIRSSDRIVVGSRDLYYPVKLTAGRQEISSDFDWDRDPNLREELLRLLFEDGRKDFKVQKVAAGIAGGLRIDCDHNLALEIFPDTSLPNEHWRLFSPGREGSHVVVTGAGGWQSI